MKGSYRKLKDIVLEVEHTILNENLVKKSNVFYKNENPVKSYLTNLNLLLNQRKLIPCIKSEIKSLLSYYDKDIISYLDSNSGSKPIGALISRFVYKKEELYRKSLFRRLNYCTSDEDLKKYVLRDYLVLGFNFYDAMYFVTTHKYETQLHIQWGIDYSQFYSKKTIIGKAVVDKSYGKKTLTLKRL